MKARFIAEANPRIGDLDKVFELSDSDMKKLTARMDTAFRQAENALFKTEGASARDRWPSLSPAYAAWKKKRFPGRKILTRKGGLRKSLTTTGGGHVATYTRGRGRNAVYLGTSVAIAAYHAPGRLHNPNLPVRDPIDDSPKTERRYLQLGAEYYRKIILPRALRFLLASRRFGRRAG